MVRGSLAEERAKYSLSNSIGVVLACAIIATVVFAFIGGWFDGDRNVPPAGQIWFGTRVDDQTAALRDRVQAVRVDQPFAYVGSLPHAMDADQVLTRRYLDGVLQSSGSFGALWLHADVWGTGNVSLGTPGKWRFELVDEEGTVLASGELSVIRPGE